MLTAWEGTTDEGKQFWSKKPFNSQTLILLQLPDFGGASLQSAGPGGIGAPATGAGMVPGR